MSLKAIKEVVEAFGREATFSESPRARKAVEARNEIKALEQAAKDVLNEDMESADATTSEDGMTRYSAACDLFQRIAKEAK